MMSSLAMIFQNSGSWGFAVLGSTLLMLFISLVITHVPLKWLGKIPILLHSIFLLPFLILLLGITTSLEQMNDVIFADPEDYAVVIELKRNTFVLLLYLMLGLYALAPFWLAFRSMMALFTIQKTKEWKQGLIGLAPSLIVWILATIGSGVIWLVSSAEGYGPLISFVMILSFAAIVPFSAMTQHHEDGDKLAFFANYLGLIGVWVLFLASWGYEWSWRLDFLANLSEDVSDLAFQNPFGSIEGGIIAFLGISFLSMILYYAVKLRTQQVQAIIVTIITLGLFTTTYLAGVDGERLIEKLKAAQIERNP